MKKTSRVALFAIAVVVAVLIISAFIPKTPFSEAERCDIHYVIAYTANAETVDVTPQVDAEQLKLLLQQVQCKRYSEPFAPYQITEGMYEITGVYNGDVFHMVLDETMGFVYESADSGGYRVTNEPLKGTILAFLDQQK